MGEREDQEKLRRSEAMVDGVRPVRYWRQQRPTTEQLTERVERLEERVNELERARWRQ